MDQIEHFNYYEDKNVQAIELRFLEDLLSAIIILPSEGTEINKYINSLVYHYQIMNIIKLLKD